MAYNYCFTTVRSENENNCIYGPFAAMRDEYKLGMYPPFNCLTNTDSYQRLKTELGYSYLIFDYQYDMADAHLIDQSEYRAAKSQGWLNNKIAISIPAELVLDHNAQPRSDQYHTMAQWLGDEIRKGGPFYGVIYHEPKMNDVRNQLNAWKMFLDLARSIAAERNSNIVEEPNLYIIANYSINDKDDPSKYWSELCTPEYVSGIIDDTYHPLENEVSYWRKELQIMKYHSKSRWSVFLNMGSSTYFKDIDKILSDAKTFMLWNDVSGPRVLWNYTGDLCSYIYLQILKHFKIVNEHYKYVDGDIYDLSELGKGAGGESRGVPDLDLSAFVEAVKVPERKWMLDALKECDSTPCMLLGFVSNLDGYIKEYQFLSYVNLVYSLLTHKQTKVFLARSLDDIPEPSMINYLSQFKFLENDINVKARFTDVRASCRQQYGMSGLIGDGGQCGCASTAAVQLRKLQCDIYMDRMRVLSSKACAMGWVRPAPKTLCYQTWMYAKCSVENPPAAPPPGYGEPDPWNFPYWILYDTSCYLDGILVHRDGISEKDENPGPVTPNTAGMQVYDGRSFAL